MLNVQIQVHESSILEFRVFGKSKLFEDSMIGQKTLKMSRAIRKESDNGKCKYVVVFLQSLDFLSGFNTYLIPFIVRCYIRF